VNIVKSPSNSKSKTISGYCLALTVKIIYITKLIFIYNIVLL